MFGSLKKDSSSVCGILEELSRNDVFFIRGQIRNIVKGEKDGHIYYLADIRSPRSNVDTDNVYSTSFNLYHVCFGSDAVLFLSLTDESMKSLKNNEVLVQIDINCTIKQYTSKEGQPFKSNIVRFFVNDIVLSKNIGSIISNVKAI